MLLSKEEKEKLLKFLHEKITDMEDCPLCKKNQWSVSDKIWEVREFFRGGLHVSDPKIPVLSITCNNCGNTIFLNAIVAGFVEPRQEGRKND